MKYCLTLFLLFFVVTSCQHTPVEAPEVPEEVEEVPHEPSKPVGQEYPVKDVKKVFTVRIVDLNYNKEQKLKLGQAQAVLEKIFNSEEYKQEVLKRKFTSTELSPQEIYEKLFAGAEALIPAVNYQMDLQVRMYYSWRRTVGYTYPSDMVVHTNSRFHNSYGVCQVASNLTHEWTHKMGFSHASARDSKSVPYAHNDIIEELCPNFL